MRLLQYSTCGIVYLVRKVTTENTGKRTAGIDLNKANTPKKKIELVKDVLDTIRKAWDKYKPLPTKRVMIPKANGKLRPLGKVVHSTECFDFLGHHIRHYENRIKGTYKLKLLRNRNEPTQRMC